MKALVVYIVFGILIYTGSGTTKNTNQINSQITETLREGDIVFQASQSRQSKAIQLATKSKYCHCGLVCKRGNEYFVFEASQTVKFTPLDKWIVSGQGGKYVVKRLKNADKILTPEVLKKMKEVNEQLKGKVYDITFEWSDDKIYCSELIWKVYQKSANIEVGKLQKLKEFDLSSEEVRTIMKERYGNKIPYNETVISPSSIFDSELLVTVRGN
jgi:predicted nucleic acid binding AN1-type Zn finger protein